MKNANKRQNRPIGFDDADDFARLRKVFYRSNYTEGGISRGRAGFNIEKLDKE